MEYTALGKLISKAKVEKCGDRSFPLLSMTMHDGIVFQNDRFKKDIASVDRSNYSVVKYNQLVVSFPIDEGVLAVQDITEYGIVSPAYKIWDINRNLIIPKYLEMWLRSPKSIDYYKSKLRGTTARRRSIPEEDFLAMPVAIPTKEIQEFAIDLIRRTKKIIELKEKEIAALDELVKARFVEMFGDPVQNPKGWKITTIGDITTDVRYGTSKPAIENGKYPYLRMNNLTFDGHLDLSDLKYIDVDDDELEKCVVRKGDVLFNRTNSIELVGKTAAFDLDEEMIIAGYIIRVRLGDCMLPDILAQYMNLEALKEKLRKMAKGAVNQANINAQELQSIKIYLPDMNSQKQFVNFKKQTDKSKLAIQKSLEKSQLLFDSLMQEYFG